MDILLHISTNKLANDVFDINTALRILNYTPLLISSNTMSLAIVMMRLILIVLDREKTYQKTLLTVGKLTVPVVAVGTI